MLRPGGNGGKEISWVDSIRQSRSDGVEFWSARDLMPFLGYREWRRFADAIERARTSADIQGHDVGRMFSQVKGVVASDNPNGTERADVLLTRFAAYLVAMNGDPRKPEVAAAQA